MGLLITKSIWNPYATANAYPIDAPVFAVLIDAIASINTIANLDSINIDVLASIY